MSTLLNTLIETPRLMAVTFRQQLAPLEGRDVPIFPATYPAPERGTHRFDTPYTINQMQDGTFVADMDSVQSQANRMEAGFSGPYADLVPQHQVQAGDHRVLLTDLPHRIADASIRATPLADAIRAAMLAYAEGDATPLAKLAPTSLVYGAWDSRDTHVKIPRAVRSEIRAFDCAIFTRSAQFTGIFSKTDLGLSDAEWKKGADAGFAPTPSVNAHGGVLVRGEIVHTASLLLPALRRYQAADEGTLAPYLLGLALTGLVHAADNYALRSGCWLVAHGAPVWERVSADGAREAWTLEPDALHEAAKGAAHAWAAASGVTLGGAPQTHRYDPKVGKRMAGQKQDDA
jgi:CRISPR-associated protein Csb1